MFNDFYRGQRVLITGHSGFKGSWLSEWLLQLGAEVAGFSDSVYSKPSHFHALGLESRMRNYWGDIRDLEALDKSFQDFRPHIGFHLAAQALVRPSYADPKTTFDTNVGGTVNVLEALRRLQTARVAVFITSDKCYENVEWDFGYRETDKLGGKDPYSASKAGSEIAVYSYFNSFFNHAPTTAIASARAGNVIGGGDWAIDRIIPIAYGPGLKNEKALLRNPRATRPWQHVLEPLSGYLSLGAEMGRHDQLRGEAFNFGPRPEANHAVLDLVEEIALHWPEAQWTVDGHQSQVLHEAKLLKLSCDKALAQLHWTPTLNFKESVRFTADWYREFYSSQRALTEIQIREYTELAAAREIAWMDDKPLYHQAMTREADVRTSAH